MSSPRVSRPSAWLLALVVPIGLACSGLPVPGAISGSDPIGEDPEPASDDPGGDVEEGDEGEGAEVPEPAGANPESLFPQLDPNEAPPYERGVVKCPPPTMTIRYPKGKTLSVYCATGSGVRSGPYTEWQRNTLVVSATNVNGKLDGPWSRWEKGEGDTLKKVEHQVYAAGVATGDHAEWDVDGRLLVRGQMVEGKRDGRFIDRKVENGELAPGGACYEGGTEVWRTSDERELGSKACGAEAIAEG